MTGEVESPLDGLACSEAPDGCKRWPLHLLGARGVELASMDSISYDTLRRVSKTPAQALAVALLVHPTSTADAEFVAAMKDARAQHVRDRSRIPKMTRLSPSSSALLRLG